MFKGLHQQHELIIIQKREAGTADFTLGDFDLYQLYLFKEQVGIP